jgi:hypothetical protein
MQTHTWYSEGMEEGGRDFDEIGNQVFLTRKSMIFATTLQSGIVCSYITNSSKPAQFVDWFDDSVMIFVGSKEND